ncbi:AI-2E family transporter [Hansschlegelia zhihuaiae]|uniref:AI-2E family transporter n=2 Tax=Hansschlegelia zhihuaiae TaxID=405005 RepID=A0A4V1KJ59_9HYPH|nr:AI-2E family transporter [Hansschlegelia zhihuaiae]
MGVVATLYVGADLLIPIALALLLSFVLSPVVSLAKRARVPRAAAVLVAVTLAFGVVLGLGATIAGQLGQLAGDLPQYQSTMRDKIQSLRGWTFGSGTLERAADMLQSLGKEFEAPEGVTIRPGEKAEPGGRPKNAPPLVEVFERPPTALENLRDITAPLLHPMATAGIIVVFVIFILLQREDLRNRLMSLAGARDIQRTTAAVDDAARRLSRLLLTQLALNAGFGITIGVGLWAIGVPSPALWGIVAGVLRFVPYVGAFIAAVFPLALAAAVDPGWTMVIATAALFAVVEPIVGHVIEPLVYGRSAGLSPVAVVVAATFWTALWGPIGLVLATPLTVCLVVLGRHVESLAFLDTLFGDRPTLTPPELFYQRMLAGDPAEAAEKAEEYLREKSLSAYYEEVAFPGLLLAQADAERGAVEGERLATLKTSVADLVDYLDAFDDVDPAEDGGAATDPETVAAIEASEPDPDAGAADLTPGPPEPEQTDPDFRVRCVGGRTPVEEAGAFIVAQIMRKHGLSPQVEDEDFLLTSGVVEMEAAGASIVLAVTLDPEETPLRLIVRRLRRRLPHSHIVVGAWSKTDRGLDFAELAKSVRADAVAFSLRDAVESCLAEAKRRSAGRKGTTARTDAEAARSSA